jgi:hypothetical protein
VQITGGHGRSPPPTSTAEQGRPLCRVCWRWYPRQRPRLHRSPRLSRLLYISCHANAYCSNRRVRMDRRPSAPWRPRRHRDHPLRRARPGTAPRKEDILLASCWPPPGPTPPPHPGVRPARGRGVRQAALDLVLAAIAAHDLAPPLGQLAHAQERRGRRARPRGPPAAAQVVPPRASVSRRGGI